ncbi:MAG TPA: 3'-5' exonuclease, partial [Nitrospirota bacterium]|nr:3'-5' exonuclease [Nitrospirota bacterium]
NEAELRTLAADPQWRAPLLRMEQILRSQNGRYDENMGREHLLLAGTKDADAAFRITESLAPLYFTAAGEPRKNPSIAKKQFTGKNRDDYENAWFSVQELLARFRDVAGRVRAGRKALALLRLYLLAGEKYEESKLREGLLDFDDLEIRAYGLLQGGESPDILYWLDRKVLHFLVDEFQDTSDIQWAVLSRLTEEIFAGQGADKRMSPTLFVVGDEKQSIYRFREANYRLLGNVRLKMESNIPVESRKILTLDKNFRSAPEIIGTVNQVFGSLWGESYKPSEAERKGHRGSVRLIEILTGSDETKTGPSEADVLAREIRLVVESGMMVYGKSFDSRHPGNDNAIKDDIWQQRRVGYGDCAVLIQSRTRLKEYEASLQKEGVPFRVVGGIGFYEEGEIQALIHTLFFLWNRDDLHSLASALRSDLFGFTDNDLYGLTAGGGNMVDALYERRPDVAGLLRGWSGLAGLAPLSTLIHKIVEDTGAYVRFGRRNPQAIFNIDKLLDTAREFDGRGYTTLQDFVEWIKNIKEAEQREATADMNLPGFQGAVSIMTVHKAKGLEFPVCFLPGMNQKPQSATSGPPVIVEGDGKVRLAVRDSSSPLYDEMWDREREELRREHQRLLYVAMTRARDHLIMIGTLREGKKLPAQNSWLEYLHGASPKPLFEAKVEAQPGMRVYSHPAAGEIPAPVHLTTRRPGETAPRGQGGLEAEGEKKLDIQQILFNLSPVPLSKTLEWKRATDFIEHDRETALELLSLRSGAGAVSPLTRGRVFHRCLEEYTKRGFYDLDAIIAENPDVRSLERDAVRAFIDDAESVLKSVLTDNELSWIFARGSGSYAELPFLYKRGNALVSGIVDRVLVRGDKGFVIDYKAILIEDDEALATWSAHYLPQIRIYCEAAKDIFGLRTVEGSLLFLDSRRLERVVSL